MSAPTTICHSDSRSPVRKTSNRFLSNIYQNLHRNHFLSSLSKWIELQIEFGMLSENSRHVAFHAFAQARRIKLKTTKLKGTKLRPLVLRSKMKSRFLCSSNQILHHHLSIFKLFLRWTQSQKIQTAKKRLNTWMIFSRTTTMKSVELIPMTRTLFYRWTNSRKVQTAKKRLNIWMIFSIITTMKCVELIPILVTHWTVFRHPNPDLCQNLHQNTGKQPPWTIIAVTAFQHQPRLIHRQNLHRSPWWQPLLHRIAYIL